jgi:hypothetical protein
MHTAHTDMHSNRFLHAVSGDFCVNVANFLCYDVMSKELKGSMLESNKNTNFRISTVASLSYPFGLR